MKKWLVIVGLFCFSTVVQATDTATLFKQYIIQNNNIDKCLFPEIYRSTDQGESVLDKWWDDTENGGRMKRSYYLKLKMRLAQRIMSSELSERFRLDTLSNEEKKHYKNAEKKIGKKVSILTPRECKKVSEYATNLIEEYDEFNEKWRSNFPNP